MEWGAWGRGGGAVEAVAGRSFPTSAAGHGQVRVHGGRGRAAEDASTADEVVVAFASTTDKVTAEAGSTADEVAAKLHLWQPRSWPRLCPRQTRSSLRPCPRRTKSLPGLHPRLGITLLE